MKHLLLSIFLLSNLALASDINIRDSIELRELYLKTYPTLFGNPSYALESEFIKTYKVLDKKTKKKVTKLIKSLDPYIPGKYLRPLIYWKYISPNQSRLEEVLLSIQVNKLSVLRDYILTPDSKERLKALDILRELIHEPEAEASSFYSYSKNDLSDKAAILARIQEDIFFKQAMLETKLFTIKLEEDLQDIDSYSLDPYGLTVGNQVELIDDNQAHNKRIKEMIKSSKETVLIDIFQFTKGKGESFSRFLINQALIKKEGFKLLILHNMKDELMPDFEYLKRKIGEDPRLGERVTLLQKKNQAPSSRDHSRLLLIDGNSPSPEAYFGNTNLSDGYANALWVKGPAAALIQDSYIQDIKAALKIKKNKLSQSSNILESFMIKRDLYPAMGQSVLRINEASEDGKIVNVRNSIIDLIKKSSMHIYIDQLFLYDSYIVDALILKKKLQPSLKIKIMLDNNESFGFNGFPNSIFIQKMKDAGIEIRTTKTEGRGSLKAHKKILSFDGKTLIVGSSNLTPEGLQGSSRELGAVVHDTHETLSFERDFEKSWSNRTETQKMNIDQFRFKLEEGFLSKTWSTFINDFAGTILRFGIIKDKD